MSKFYMGYIVPASIIFPILAALLCRKGMYPSGYHVLVSYLFVTALTSIISKILVVNHISNIPLLHADTILEVSLLLAYLGVVLKTKGFRTYVQLIMLTFALYCFFNFIFLQSIFSFNTYTRPVGAILIIALCLFYWWEYKPIDESGKWTTNAHNWFVSGIMLYFSSALILFIFSNYLAIHVDKAKNVFIWNVHATFVLIMYIFFTIGFLNAKLRR